MGSDKSFYKVFFNDYEFSLGFSELISANSRFLTYCDETRSIPFGVFAEIVELKYSLCRVNIYYSDEQDELELGVGILSSLIRSEAIPSLFKVRHLIVAEHLIPGEISHEHWKERLDVAGLIKHRQQPPAALRCDFLIRSTLYDSNELNAIARETPLNRVLDSFRSYLPGQSSRQSFGK